MTCTYCYSAPGPLRTHLLYDLFHSFNPTLSLRASETDLKPTQNKYLVPLAYLVIHRIEVLFEDTSPLRLAYRASHAIFHPMIRVLLVCLKDGENKEGSR